MNKYNTYEKGFLFFFSIVTKRSLSGSGPRRRDRSSVRDSLSSRNASNINTEDFAGNLRGRPFNPVRTFKGLPLYLFSGKWYRSLSVFDMLVRFLLQPSHQTLHTTISAPDPSDYNLSTNHFPYNLNISHSQPQKLQQYCSKTIQVHHHDPLFA